MIAPAYMNNHRLNEIIDQVSKRVIEHQTGFWKFEFQEATVFVITDEMHNRMRIMTPVIAADEVRSEQWPILMQANFDRALDARYCVNDEFLWSAFIHPLQELSADQFVDSLKQVVCLARNYGTSYSSGNLVFGGDSGE